MFLTPDDVVELTGYQRHADQRRWLTSRGWIFEVSRIGRPIIGRDYAKQKTGFSVTGVDAPRRKTWAPNVAAIQRVA